MSSQAPNRQKRGLYTLAMVNVVVWAIAMVALVILMEKGGNLKGMYVILAGGTAVGVQVIASVAKLK